MRITYFCLIISIDNTITIGIYKPKVTWLQVITLKRVSSITILQCCLITVYICLVLKNAIGLVTIEVAHRFSFLESSHECCSLRQKSLTTIDVARAIIYLCNLILIGCYIPTYIVSEVLTNAVIPRKCQLNTSILNTTSIIHNRREAIDRRNRYIKEQILGLLYIVIKVYAQTLVQETSIKTKVKLLRGLPFQLRVSHTCRIATCGTILLVIIERILTVCAERIGCRIFVSTNILITILTPRSTNLQEVKPS